MIGDEDLNLAMSKGHDAFYDENAGGLYGLDGDELDESITKSYNQKVKDDTNFLANQKDLYDESPRTNKTKDRKDADILYNLQMRPSYDQLPG